MTRRPNPTHTQHLPIDDEDRGLLASYHWTANTYGHLRRRESGKTIYLHREILVRKIGRPLRRREYADHANMQKLDNRRCNLRVCTAAQNNANKPSLTKRFKGVSRPAKWPNLIYGKITHNGKTRHLGRFFTEEDAARAYDAAAVELYGEFARLNCPPNSAYKEVHK